MMLALTLSLSLAVSVPLMAQKSVALMGDKNIAEVDRSTNVFKSRIADLKAEIVSLETERDKKIVTMERKKSQLLKHGDLYSIVIDSLEKRSQRCWKQTESLINSYQQKILNLNDELSAFTINAAGKDQQNVMALKSRNVSEFADAYMTVKYADNMSTPANVSDLNSKKLIGIVCNESYKNPVVVYVNGPANFHREFTLTSKSKSEEFTLPCIGKYTATFIGNFPNTCVTKRVWPNTVYYGKDGKAYDFMAALIYN